MSSWYSSGGSFYDRIMARLSAYAPAQIESFEPTRYGAEPEDRFTDLVEENIAPGDTVIDLGTGTGSWFLRQVAPQVSRAIGIDESGLSLLEAVSTARSLGVSNAVFLQADAGRIPLPDCRAAAVISRRGPLTATAEILKEACRVLAPGGLAIEITIGEKNAREVTRAFGYSQMAGEARLGPRLPRIEALVRSVGLEPIVGEDFCQPEYFPGPEALQYRLLTTPIVHDYHPDAHAAQFEALVRRCSTDEGIMLTYHRIVLAARKPA